MTLMNIRLRGALYVSIETKRKILDVVKKIGGEYMTATSYLKISCDSTSRLHIGDSMYYYLVIGFPFL